MPKPQIRTVKISDLILDSENANKGTTRGRALLEKSLKNYGAGRSILIDKKNRVVAGNKTLEAAIAAGATSIIVVEGDGSTLAAVQRTDLDLKKDRKAKELAIADNRVAEVDLAWDAEVLSKMQGVDLAEMWNESELSKVLGDFAPPKLAPDAKIDDAEKLLKKWKASRGQLWRIGGHRLLCGDSSSDDVAWLMNGKKAVLMNTDPPYGIDYSKLKNGIPGSGFEKHTEQWGDIENDTLVDGSELQAFLESVIRTAVPHLVENCAFYLWHPMLTQGTFFAAAAAAAADILIHRQIIWVKPGFVLTRSGMYHWKHELCFYGWIRGKKPAWYGDKSQTSVWELGRDDDSGQHPTQKPIEIFSRPILNHSKLGEIVYEPFAGSGSQFCAAELNHRVCYGMEIEPRYVAVTLERLSEMGLKPKLESPRKGQTIGHGKSESTD